MGFIADGPLVWPEDVRERMAAERREIEAVREQDAETTERVGTIWSDWLRRLRETGEASDLNITDYLG